MVKPANTGTPRRAANTRRRGGRPSKEDAVQLRGHIITTAATVFLEHGYGSTSIETIAKKAGISKRTFYHRFADKAELFGAVIQELVTKMRPAGSEHLFEGDNLESILPKLGLAMLKAALSPEALGLQRILTAESARFPELAEIANTSGSRQKAIDHIAVLLEHKSKHINIDGKFAAEQFMQMIISAPQRRAMGLGQSLSDAELADWVAMTVRLFLSGFLQR